MWKWVIRDYFAAFRWEKVKVWLKSGVWWWPIYMAFILPLCVGFADSAMEMFIYIMTSGPLLFGLVSEGIHSEIMPKILYLCPMHKAKRMKYVEKTYVFRIIIVVFLEMISVILFLVGGICEPLTALVIIYDGTIAGIILCGLCSMKNIPRGEEKKNNALGARIEGVVELSDLIITMLSLYGVVGILTCDIPVEKWAKWVFVVVAVVIQLPLTIKILSKWKAKVEKVSVYEASV